MVGFSLVELMVAMVVTLLVLAAALTVAMPAAAGFHALPEHADVQQRTRTLVETLRADVGSAIGGPVVGGLSQTQAWPAVLPCGWGRDPVSGAPSPCARPGVLSVVLADRPLQSVTTVSVTGSAAAVAVSRPHGCAAGLPACQFAAGDRGLIADGHGSADALDVQTVSADGEWLAFDPGSLSGPYPANSVVAAASVRTYYIADEPSSGGRQLRRIEGRQDVPVLDHLAAFDVEFFGEAAPPAVTVLPDGRLRASYGPPPPDDWPENGGGWPPGENCLFRDGDGFPVSKLAGLTAGADGLALIPLATLADGPWCPDSGARARYDADLYRIRRLRMTVRMSAASVAARGVTPAWFARPGTARAAERLVPDVSVRFDVAVAGTGR